MTVVLRPLSVPDVPAVAALEAGNQPAPWSEDVFLSEMDAEKRLYLVADDDGVVVGFGGVIVMVDEAHVTNLLVDPAWRRRGIGIGLMKALIEEAIDIGARHLTLEVRARNEAARGLYARLGLVPVGVRKGYYGDDDALILWAHDIDGADYRERLEGLR